MAIIRCETCNKIIAEHGCPSEAEEIAFEADAARDREADVWECSSCYDAALVQWSEEALVLDAEASLRAMQDDAHEYGPMVAYLRAKGQA